MDEAPSLQAIDSYCCFDVLLMYNRHFDYLCIISKLVLSVYLAQAMLQVGKRKLKARELYIYTYIYTCIYVCIYIYICIIALYYIMCYDII